MRLTTCKMLLRTTTSQLKVNGSQMLLCNQNLNWSLENQLDLLLNTIKFFIQDNPWLKQKHLPLLNYISHIQFNLTSSYTLKVRMPGLTNNTIRAMKLHMQLMLLKTLLSSLQYFQMLLCKRNLAKLSKLNYTSHIQFNHILSHMVKMRMPGLINNMTRAMS
jgi:hypothetical protein